MERFSREKYTGNNSPGFQILLLFLSNFTVLIKKWLKSLLKIALYYNSKLACRRLRFPASQLTNDPSYCADIWHGLGFSFSPTVSWQATELFYGAIKIRQSAVDGMTRRTLVKVCQWSVTIRFDTKNQRPIEKIHQISYWSVSSEPFYYIPINLVLNYNFLWLYLFLEAL